MLTFNVINKNIIGSVEGKDFSIPYDKKSWEDLQKAQEEINKADSLKKAREVVEKLKTLVFQTTKTQIEDKSPFLTFDPSTKTYHLKKEDKVSPIPLPQNLVDKMIYAIDEGLPIDPLVKYTIRILRNPNITDGSTREATSFLHRTTAYTFQKFVSPNLYEKFHKEDGFSEEVAREMALVPQTPITTEGLMSTKKVVLPVYEEMRYKFIKDDEGEVKRILRDADQKQVDETTGKVTWVDPEFAEDFIFMPAVMRNNGDEFSIGPRGGEGTTWGHRIRVGAVHSLKSWDQVDCSTRNYSKGLHLGNFDYIKGYEHSATITVNCLVDPANIGAIPVMDVPGVIRVLEYQVNSIKDRDIDNRNLYLSSDYAELSDSQWESNVQEVLDNFDKKEKDFMENLQKDKAKYLF